MSIANQITRIQNEVTTQEDLIAQITAALQGKAAGGSGDGSSDELTNVTVNFNWDAPIESAAPKVFYTRYRDANLFGDVYDASSSSGNTTLTIAKNSIIWITPNTASDLYGVDLYSSSSGIKRIYNIWTTQAYINSVFLISDSGDLSVSMRYGSSSGSND